MILHSCFCTGHPLLNLLPDLTGRPIYYLIALTIGTKLTKRCPYLVVSPRLDLTSCIAVLRSSTNHFTRGDWIIIHQLATCDRQTYLPKVPTAQLLPFTFSIGILLTSTTYLPNWQRAIHFPPYLLFYTTPKIQSLSLFSPSTLPKLTSSTILISRPSIGRSGILQVASWKTSTTTSPGRLRHLSPYRLRSHRLLFPMLPLRELHLQLMSLHQTPLLPAL